MLLPNALLIKLCYILDQPAQSCLCATVMGSCQSPVSVLA